MSVYDTLRTRYFVIQCPSYDVLYEIGISRRNIVHVMLRTKYLEPRFSTFTNSTSYGLTFMRIIERDIWRFNKKTCEISRPKSHTNDIASRDISYKASHERHCIARYLVQSVYHERHCVARYFIIRCEGVKCYLGNSTRKNSIFQQWAHVCFCSNIFLPQLTGWLSSATMRIIGKRFS